ncbi:hypothetical protein ACHAXA_006384, partial [Cyclostephanos tholiformis]
GWLHNSTKTMKFRPLCIDYHSRAREIVATKREILAHRIALRSLPNLSSTPCDRRRGTSQSEDSIGPAGGRGDPPLGSGEKKTDSTPRANDGRIDDIDYETTVKVHERLDESNVDSLGLAQQSNADANKRRDGSRARILWCMDMLGAAVHPSECTFRSIEPVTNGPVRGNKIPIAQELPKLLADNAKLYSDQVDKKLDAVIASLETGRSRFDSTSGHVFGVSSDEPMQSGFYEVPHRATFAETMKVVYGRTSGFCDFDDSCLDLDPDQENALNSQIWTQHVNDMPTTTSIYLRHDPDDFAKVYSLQSLISCANTSFASYVKRSFRPQLFTTTSDGLGMIRARAENLGTLSAEPSFDASVYGISRSSKKYGNKLLSDSVPFDDDSSMGQITDNFRITATYNDTDKDMAQTGVLALVDSTRRYTIRLDPEFDPQHLLLPKNERMIHERMMSLYEMFNASSIITLLQRPGRFEESLEVSLHQPKDIRHLEFFSTPLKICKESNEEDDSLESLLSVYETRASMSSMKFQPRKIRLDADINTPVLLGEMLLGNGDQLLKDNAKKSVLPSNLKLPLLYDMLTSPRKLMIIAGRQSGGVSQKHFVESPSRVSNMFALKNLVNSSRVTSLFLPECIVENSTGVCAGSNAPISRRMDPMPTAIASAIRAHVQHDPKTIKKGDIKFLQEQCSTYPVAPWFACYSSGSWVSTKLSELDENILKKKRNTFCDNAKSKLYDEGIRCLLFTGCSSKRNVNFKFSYRGFLTNQVVEPHVFQRRYNSMVQVDKFHNRKRNQNTLGGRSPSPAHEALFTPMVLRVYAEAFARHEKLNSTGRSAPYSVKMKTSRHGQGQITASMTNKKNLSKGKTEFFIDTESIEKLATCFKSRLAQEADTNNGDSDCGRAFEALGKNCLKTRGELLHLLTKARELEVEKKSYFADLAVANRSFLGTGNIVAEVGVDTLYSSPHLVGTIGLAVPDNYHRGEKRKTESDPSLKEHKKKKKSKKEKKKDKKRKEKIKRHRKQKLGDDGPNDESKKCKASETKSQEKQSRKSSSASLNKTSIRVLLPSIPLGMTPIIPSNKLEARKNLGAVEQSKPQNERVAELAIKDPHYSPAEIETFPVSFAALNSKSFHGSETEARCKQWAGQSRKFEHNATGIDEMSRHEDVDNGEFNGNESSLTNESINAPSQVRSPRNLLTSENFLETFGHVVAELASGRWRNALSVSENSGFDDSTLEITVIDSPLLDVTGVDIEFSDDSAAVVQYLSSWSENDQNGRGNVSSVQRGARAFIRRLVVLAASGRYNAIHVILCVDVDMSSALSGELVTLQNAVIQQTGCPVERVSFEYVGPRALSASIAMLLMSTPPEIGGHHSISDQIVQERAWFLIALVPTMTMHMALRCCLEYSSGSNSLSDLFEVARSTSRDMFPYKMDGILSKCASDQLWSVVNIDVLHAY